MAIKKNFSHKKTSPDNYKRAVINEKTLFQVKEAYKATRTNIMFSLIQPGCKTILFTSASPGEGKSTVCINTAITFAQTGAKVLVIDGDLRKPRVHRLLKENNMPGLTNLLGGFCELEYSIRESSIANLHFISAGSIPPNPAELLGSDKMKQYIEQLQEKYDYIFIDSPPINVVSDALTVSSYVSGVVLVCRQNYTTHEMLQKATESLEFVKAKVLGLVLNDSSNEKARKYSLKYTNKKTSYQNYTYSLYSDDAK
ncbi:MAG: capsular exopolysaccharide family protein [Oscillospiraceae bacterium]|nr:capsular exopolysaccharide family protein [Oscillospiraceae bacterium]